ncbi:MAG: HlyD family efflux transporter periplasmic adaptor subunit [Cytophagales bacterium]|nr:MAG: HlyD family efflux transporter periplasmic adaptor subunit [Cytophagales bacterium]
MVRYLYLIAFSYLLLACESKEQFTKPQISSISESIYASGIVKSQSQYQAFANVSGIVETLFKKEGDSIKIGEPILLISNKAQQLNKENAALLASYSDYSANKSKLDEAAQLVALSESRMKLDSTLWVRQSRLWQNQIGSKLDLEQKELAYKNAQLNYKSAQFKLDDLKRLLKLNAEQTKTNFQISLKQEKDFVLKSELDGVVFSIYKRKGELVTPQSPLAIVGNNKQFVLEMQVDEYDIFRIKEGLKVLLSLDSYKGQVFEANVSRINPIMNERTKTFLVEALFVKAPPKLYPNITFEANIVIQKKENVLLIPRSLLKDDSLVALKNGTFVKVKVGLKDYKNVEILSGIGAADELVIPKK